MHAVHTVVEEEYWPGLHATHTVACAALMYPALQGVHAAAPVVPLWHP